MSPDMQGITEETLDAIQKALTAGVTVATNVTGYDLTKPVSLIPINTPWFSRVRRVNAGQGSLATHWKAFLNVNNNQPNPFTGLEGGGNYANISEEDIMALFQPVRLSGYVTRDAMALGRGYYDPKSLAVAQTLLQWRLADEKALLGGQNFALPAIGATTLTAQATGGTIGASIVVHVRVAARSTYNYYYGGSGIPSTDNSVTVSAGTVNSVLATWAAVKGAVAYDIWVANGAGTFFYYGSTTVNTVTVTSMPVANATPPSFPAFATTLTNGQGTAVTAIPTADFSYNSSAYNGLMASLAGDVGTGASLVTPGTGTASGATFQSLDGAKLTGTSGGITEIDNWLQTIFDTAQVSPTALLMNSQQAKDIKNHIWGGGNAVTYLDPQSNGRVGATAGGSFAHYINGSSGGDILEIIVDPQMPVGTVIAICEMVPYPDSGISNPFELRTLQDVTQFDYGAPLVVGANGGPRDIWDVSSIETFVNRAPVTCGVLSNIAAG